MGYRIFPFNMREDHINTKKSINNLLTLDSQGTKTRRVNNPCTLLRNQVNSKYIELR